MPNFMPNMHRFVWSLSTSRDCKWQHYNVKQLNETIFTERKAKTHRDYFRGIFLIGKLGRWSSKNMILLFFIFLSFCGLVVNKKSKLFRKKQVI